VSACVPQNVVFGAQNISRINFMEAYMPPMVPCVLKLSRQLQNCHNAALFSFYYPQETKTGGLASPILILVAISKESGLKTCNEAALTRLKWISNEVRARNLATETCESLRSAHTDWFQVNYCISETTQQVYLKVFATKPSSPLKHINCPILWQQSRKCNTGTVAAHLQSSSHSIWGYHSTSSNYTLCDKMSKNY
jgi:hypothetical protein